MSEARGHSSSQFQEFVEMRRIQALERIERIPIAALIWGPAPTSDIPIASVRSRLRDELVQRNHLASFSEEVIDPNSPHSNFAQQVAQAEAYDIVFSIPGSPGSIAEIHDFARIPWLSPKIVAFLNQEWNDGYSNQSLIQLRSNATCQIQMYDGKDLPNCIIEPAIILIRRLQELYYVAGRRF